MAKAMGSVNSFQVLDNVAHHLTLACLPLWYAGIFLEVWISPILDEEGVERVDGIFTYGLGLGFSYPILQIIESSSLHDLLEEENSGKHLLV